VGPPNEVLNAFIDLNVELQKRGYRINPTKSELFSFTELENDVRLRAVEMELIVKSCDDGIIIAGSPVGTAEFERKICLNKVDDIVNNLEKIRGILSTPTVFTNSQLQTAYMLIRQCFPQQLNHLLRTCQPSVTFDAAQLLDKNLEKFVIDMVHMSELFDDGNQNKLIDVVKRLHLAIRSGGGGINSSVNSRKAAYVGSLALCANHMMEIFPDIVINETIHCDSAYSLNEYIQIVEEFRGMDIKTEDFDIDKIWENSIPKIQNKINKELSDMVETELYHSLPNGNPRNGINGIDSYNDKAVRIQGMANKDPTVSAFLLANPVFYSNKLKNNAFIYALRTRMLLSVVGSRKFCICGHPMDLFAQHTSCCPTATLRNKAHNTAHAIVNQAVKDSIISCTSHVEDISVLHSEPFVNEFFPPCQKSNRSINSNFNRNRLDIAIIDNSNPSKSIFIDTTIVSCMQKKMKDYESCGDAALFGQKKKETEYAKNYDMTNNDLGKAHIFAVESNGCIALSSRIEICKYFANMATEDFSIALSRIYQKISVAFHKSRAMQIYNTVRHYSVDEKPSIKYVRGNLPDDNIPLPAYFYNELY
jgi:hypothetical protein